MQPLVSKSLFLSEPPDHFKLNVGGVQYQGRKLGWNELNPGQGLDRNLPVTAAFQGLELKGPCRKVMETPSSGDSPSVS